MRIRIIFSTYSKSIPLPFPVILSITPSKIFVIALLSILGPAMEKEALSAANTNTLIIEAL